MKVLGINGSARKDGNTAIIMNKVFDELNKQGIETELVQFAGQVIEPCKACFACGDQKNCVHRKDICRETFDKMMEADGILLSSPVYSANISAGMQAPPLITKSGSWRKSYGISARISVTAQKSKTFCPRFPSISSAKVSLTIRRRLPSC